MSVTNVTINFLWKEYNGKDELISYPFDTIAGWVEHLPNIDPPYKASANFTDRADAYAGREVFFKDKERAKLWVESVLKKYLHEKNLERRDLKFPEQ